MIEKYNRFHRSFIGFLLFFHFMLLLGLQNVSAQTASADVSISFLKATDSIKPNDMYFNIVRLRNNTTKKITGSLVFNGPENWKIISFSDEKLQLMPGDSISIPVRVSQASCFFRSRLCAAAVEPFVLSASFS